jgi:hypothetical protein
MAGRRTIIFVAASFLYLATLATSQTQTAGRLTGAVKDAQGGVIVAAEVSVENPATADKVFGQDR